MRLLSILLITVSMFVFVGTVSAESIKLNNPITIADGDVTAFMLTANGETVVYSATSEQAGQTQLYRVAASGVSAAIKLNPSLPAFGSVISPTLTPDDTQVLFLADTAEDGRYELYKTALSGGTPVKLNTTLTSGRTIQQFAVSPDGQQVFYIADADTDDVQELYLTSLAGGSVTKLNHMLSPSADILNAKFSPNSNLVAYRAGVVNNSQLYVSAMSSGSAILVSQNSDAWQEVANFAFTPDSSRVVFNGEQSVQDRWETFTNLTVGGAQASLNSVPNYGDPNDRFVSTTSGRVVFEAGTKLFSAPMTGGSAAFIVEDYFSFAVTPDGSSILYHPDILFAYIYSKPVAGGSEQQLSDFSPFRAQPDGKTNFAFTNNDYVVYRSRSIRAAPLAGGTNINLTPNLSTSQEEVNFVINDSGSHVVTQSYRNKSQSLTEYQLWLSSVTGGDTIEVDTVEGYVSPLAYAYQACPDGSCVIYISDHAVGDKFELYRWTESAPTVIQLIKQDGARGQNNLGLLLLIACLMTGVVLALQRGKNVRKA